MLLLIFIEGISAVCLSDYLSPLPDSFDKAQLAA
jgi:hypothetical protein